MKILVILQKGIRRFWRMEVLAHPIWHLSNLANGNFSTSNSSTWKFWHKTMEIFAHQILTHIRFRHKTHFAHTKFGIWKFWHIQIWRKGVIESLTRNYPQLDRLK